MAGRISMPGCEDSGATAAQQHQQHQQHLNRIKFFSESGQPVATFTIPYYKVRERERDLIIISQLQ